MIGKPPLLILSDLLESTEEWQGELLLPSPAIPGPPVRHQVISDGTGSRFVVWLNLPSGGLLYVYMSRRYVRFVEALQADHEWIRDHIEELAVLLEKHGHGVVDVKGRGDG